MSLLVMVLLALIAIVTGAWLYGTRRWDAGTRTLRSRLDAARAPVKPQGVDFRELESLPAVVQRYFRAVLADGQPMVAGVTLRHHGSFNMGETSDSWKPFTSSQRVITRRPGFDWDARIAMMPGLTVRVHDSYIAGEGILHASLLGLISVADLRGTDELAEGELMRFFAEAVWYPTALLPSQGVAWRGVDERSALATLTDGARSTTLLFTFDDQGLIVGVGAEARGRSVGGKNVPTPWQGRFWGYAERNGMKVPLDGEVAWMLPEGAKPYWRGHLTELIYDPAE